MACCVALHSAVLSWLGCVAAQNGSFRVQTKVVQVPVSVTAKNGRSIDGLVARDFRVLDDGAQQEITVDDFNTGLPRISLAIAVQKSGISTPALTSIRRIAGMIQPLVTGPRGEAAVVTFDSQIKWLQDFTPDDDKIQYAVQSLKPGSLGQARMLDAIAEAVDRMQQRKGRKVLLLISEARDRGSETKFQQAIEAVERQGIQVFAAHYSAYATSLIAKPKDLPELPPSPDSDDPEDPPNPPPTVNFLANGDRLKKTQAEIQKILPEKAEYVVNTSEYAEVRGRLLAIENQRKLRSTEKDPKGPVLRRSPGSGTPAPPDNDSGDDRPTIKRRDLEE